MTRALLQLLDSFCAPLDGTDDGYSCVQGSVLYQSHHDLDGPIAEIASSKQEFETSRNQQRQKQADSKEISMVKMGDESRNSDTIGVQLPSGTGSGTNI